jgi:hypothetical protein
MMPSTPMTLSSPIARFVFASLILLMPSPVHAADTGFAAEVKAANLAAHKALYDIRLSGTKSGAQIVNITGQMLYEWQPSCEGWISNHKFNLYYEYADNPSMRVISDFSTFEPFDGKSLNFISQRKRDGELFESIRGNASLDKGQAIYTLPEGLTFNLAPGTLFPMSHTMNVLKAIKEGKKFYNATLFDGSDDEGPVEVNTFIGKAIDVSNDFKPSKDLDVSLVKSPAHQVRLAFFPVDDPSESSDYEMNMTFLENGVISQMDIEYNDFSITQKLVAIQPLPDSCGAKPKSQ